MNTQTYSRISLVLVLVLFSGWVERVRSDEIEQRNRMGWPLPLEQESAWKLLPTALHGKGEALPSWARILVREMPKTTAAFLELDSAQRTKGPVDPKLRAAMRWVAARANSCDYAMSVAAADGKRAGVSDAAWNELKENDRSSWSQGDRSALDFALAMTVDSEGYSDAKFAELVAAFDERQAAAMVLHLAYANFQDRLLLCLGAEIESTDLLPATDWKFSPEELVSTTTPPPANPPSTENSDRKAPKEAGSSESQKQYTWLPYDSLQERLEKQRRRQTRLRIPEWNEFASRLPKGLMDKPSDIVWYRIAFGYADELAVPFEIYMRTAGSEVSKNWDRIFGNSLFWMVTDAMKCPYCMGHCEMNWEVAGLSLKEIEERSRILAGNDWSSYTIRQQEALGFARNLTKSPGKIDRQVMDDLRAGFGDQRALFIALNCSRYNYMTRISNGFQLTLESENVFWDYYRMKAPTQSASPNASNQDLADAPRPTPLTRPEMKRMLEDMKTRTPRIPLPELSAEEQEKAKVDTRSFGYEGRVRSTYIPNSDAGGYLPFSGSSTQSISGGRNGVPDRNGRIPPTPDPVLSLTYLFKTQLFWIASRANNCQYCLGHQESKLLAAGMIEDQLAALDTNWEAFEEKERVAFALARRLTLEPHRLTDSDIDQCRPFYSDLQILEMISSVAGNNAINRWKEGIGVPQSSGGGNFGSRASAGSAAETRTESHSYLTETSPQFAQVETKVALVSNRRMSDIQAATEADRSSLAMWTELREMLLRSSQRKPRLPMVDVDKAIQVLEYSEGLRPNAWERLMANFPIAGKRAVTGFKSAENGDHLSPIVRGQLKWVVARQDQAMYAMAEAEKQLLEAGYTLKDIENLNRVFFDKSGDSTKLSDSEHALIVLAMNLAASPVVLTDRQVETAVKEAGPRAVAQAIHYTAFLAAYDRITEAAGLSTN